MMAAQGYFYRWICVAFPILAAVLCTSCGGPSRKAVYPASGKVVYNKTTPADGVLLIFTPLNEAESNKNWPDGFPRATTQKDGTFFLTTYKEGDGIPTGEYAVTMMWTLPLPDDRERNAEDRFGGRYSDPKKSAWKVTIQPGDNELPVFHVQ